MAGEGLLWPYNYLGCAVKSQIPLQLHMAHYKPRHTFTFQTRGECKKDTQYSAQALWYVWSHKLPIGGLVPGSM